MKKITIIIFILLGLNLYAKDNITNIGNLMWQDEPYRQKEIKAYTNYVEYGKVLNWKSAKSYCTNLTLGGFNDWYLPSKVELKELYKNKNKLKNLVSNNYNSSRYWSSTIHSEDGNWAFIVEFYGGFESTLMVFSPFYVRCVRVK